MKLHEMCVGNISESESFLPRTPEKSRSCWVVTMTKHRINLPVSLLFLDVNNVKPCHRPEELITKQKNIALLLCLEI